MLSRHGDARRGSPSSSRPRSWRGAWRAWSPPACSEKDRFQRVLELDPDDFRFDADYPDLDVSSDG